MTPTRNHRAPEAQPHGSLLASMSMVLHYHEELELPCQWDAWSEILPKKQAVK
jgi:hypothetical protein